MSQAWSHEISPADRAAAATAVLGSEVFAAWCVDVLTGTIGMDRLVAEPEPDPRWLADGAWSSWGPPETWTERGLDYWPRVWAARSLLHQWSAAAESAIVAGLGDDHWRVREMCAKVAAKHGLTSAADGCARIVVRDDNTRARIAALRTVGLLGESEHAEAVASATTDPDRKIADAARTALTSMVARLDRPVESLLGDP